MLDTNVSLGTPKRKYRVIIQERKSKLNKTDKMRSFMIYDYDGKSNIDSLKQNIIKEFRK